MSASGRLRESGWQALQQGKLDQADQLLQSAERLDRQAKDKRALAATLNGLAGVRRFQGRFEDSMSILEEVEALARELNEPQDLVNALGNRAALLREIAQTEDRPDRIQAALALVDQSEELSQRYGLFGSLQFAYGTRALLMRDLGNLDGAFESMNRQLEVARKLGKEDEVARCLTNLAMLSVERGDPAAARGYLNEGEPLARRLRLGPLVDGMGRIRSMLGHVRSTLPREDKKPRS